MQTGLPTLDLRPSVNFAVIYDRKMCKITSGQRTQKNKKLEKKPFTCEDLGPLI